jgi:ABC-type antimicrobial peptide transport system permease subunit
VGVVQNVRHIDLANDANPEIYIPVTQEPFEWATIVVRAQGDPAANLTQTIRESVRRIDPELPVFNVQTLTSVVYRSLARTRAVTSLLVLFAAIGLGLAGIGVFSVVSFTVGRRLREVAIRIAVGGSPGRVVALIVRQGLFPVTVGLFLGVAMALFAMRIIASSLFGVAAHDPTTFVGACLLVLTISAAATWIPARRAARVEPMTVLRTE